MLTAEMNALRVEIFLQLLSCCENEGEEFLYNIVTASEAWVQHYESKTTCQSVEYHRKDSPEKKKKN
jgi:hypothetical protein